MEVAVAGRLGIVRALVRIPSAILPLVVAATHGASGATDTFFLVYAGVLVASSTVAIAETAIVPFISTTGEPRRSAFVVHVLARIVALGALLLLALLGGALAWRAVAPGATPAGWQHLLVLATVPALSAAASVLTGSLNADQRFLTAALATGIRGTIALAVSVVVAPAAGLVGYSIGILCGEVIGVLWLLRVSGLGARGQRRRPDTAEVREFWLLFRSLLTGSFANSSRALADRLVASLLGPGAVSLLEYAHRIFLMAMSIAGAPLATVLLSRWAAERDAAGPDRAARLRTSIAHLRPRLVLLGLLMFLAALLGSQLAVVSAAIERRMSGDSHLFLATLLVFFLGAAPYLLGLVTSQAILVLRDARFVTILTVSIAVLTPPANAAGLLAFGLPGIAIASSGLNLLAWVATEHRLRTRASPASAHGVASGSSS